MKLTQFSPGAGCGCKIAPAVLQTILNTSEHLPHFPQLLVGNETKDDAAVFDIGGGQAIISTTDFFTPIVDDPYDFGRIAAANAISDIYAMGGTPLMAIAILGWPLDKLSAEEAANVIAGARQICGEASIPLAGGHSIDIDVPIFGLAVTGMVSTNSIQKNSTAQDEAILFITKPLGIGLVTTAQKLGLATTAQKSAALQLMTRLNSAGAHFAQIPDVCAMTDVTGFGLLGHCVEMAEGCGLCGEIDHQKVPYTEGVDSLITQGSIPGGTFRNFNSYGNKVSPLTHFQKALLCDPQTNGGLLVAVLPQGVEQLTSVALQISTPLYKIGQFVTKRDYICTIT
ncbi:MAG: selenide, water dikinase SelD [Prevotellaceae bacterium]|jgi:selenide,water dikinase|nr:selenide, water dikinase SelD [Prevotellaceae bacterium]